jgi:hypothetical protein
MITQEVLIRTSTPQSAPSRQEFPNMSGYGARSSTTKPGGIPQAANGHPPTGGYPPVELDPKPTLGPGCRSSSESGNLDGAVGGYGDAPHEGSTPGAS